ncbi:hypothetical protein C2E23DRAFT_849498 [Lenzites betulinus]|nr:hypothetical protein C2E23DRAFT_849498 [Lenzites betulinus]
MNASRRYGEGSPPPCTKLKLDTLCVKRYRYHALCPSPRSLPASGDPNMETQNIDWSITGFQIIEPEYSLLSTTCLLYYDYCLTLTSEIELVWRRKWSPATGFYLAIRYGVLIVNTMSVFHVFFRGPPSGPGMTHESCQGVQDAILIFNVIYFAVISAFVALRISALWSRNWYLGIFLFALGLINPSSVTPMLAFGFESLPGPRPLVACMSYLPNDADSIGSLTTKYFPIICSVTGIVYELLCLLLTVGKTLSLYRDQREMGMSTRLTSLLLHDGSLYFAVLAILAVINIISATIPIGILPAFTQVNADSARALTPILITRFIANLRTVEQETRAMGHLPTLHFDHPTSSRWTLQSLSMPLEFPHKSEEELPPLAEPSHSDTGSDDKSPSDVEHV